MSLTPNNREEHFLQGMVDGSTTLTPNNRKEHWYKEIIDSIGSGGGGGGGGVLVVHVTSDTLDKTWNEIVNAGFAVIFDDSMPFVGTQIWVLIRFKADEEEPEYDVTFRNLFNMDADTISYLSASEDGYPVADK